VVERAGFRFSTAPVHRNRTVTFPTLRLHLAPLRPLAHAKKTSGRDGEGRDAEDRQRHPAFRQECRRQQRYAGYPARSDGRRHRPFGRRQVHAAAHDQSPHRPLRRVDFFWRRPGFRPAGRGAPQLAARLRHDLPAVQPRAAPRCHHQRDARPAEPPRRGIRHSFPGFPIGQKRGRRLAYGRPGPSQGGSSWS
jgi:hypothetical protein